MNFVKKYKKLKVGLVGLIQLNYRGDKESVYNRSIKELEDLARELDFDFFYRKELVVTRQDALKAKEQMEGERIDLLLVQSTSFSSGYLIQELAETNAYIALWAVPENTNSGPLPLNSFCNMNLNMSELDRFLFYLNKDAKWFYGYPKEELFRKRFEVTVRALRAIKNIKGSKYLLIGGRAPGFDNLFYDPRILKSKLGVSVDEMEFGDLKARFINQSDEKVREIVEDIEGKYKIKDEFAKNSIEKMARLISTIRELENEGNYDGFAIACWPKFRIELGMVPCASYAYLSDELTTTVCEGDIISLLSMKILQYIADYPAILMDLSHFDLSDDSIFLWHCGIGSKFYGKSDTMFLEKHFNPGPKDPKKGWLTMAPVVSMEFENIPVTVMRITNNLDEYFVISGEFIDSENKPNFDGSRGWLGKLKYFEKEIRVLDLINTIMVNKLEHHFPIVKGNYTNEIIEFMNWLGLNEVRKVEYRDYYQRRKD